MLSVVRAPHALGPQPDFEAVQAWLLIMERSGWQVATLRPTVGFNGVVIELAARARDSCRIRRHDKVPATPSGRNAASDIRYG